MLRKSVICALLSISLSNLASAQAVDVMSTVFGVTTRTPYCSYDAGRYVPVFWLQDVIYPLAANHDLVLRYTTKHCNDTAPPGQPTCLSPAAPTGNMSVYERVDNSIYVVAEYGIWSNSAGTPVVQKDIAQYNPPKPFSPRYIPINQSPGSWTRNQGTLSYCLIGINCPPQPVIGSAYDYEVATVTNGTDLWLDENFFQTAPVDPPPMCANSAFSSWVYARTFVYSTAGGGRSLRAFTDRCLATPRTYQRFTTVDTNGACQGPF